MSFRSHSKSSTHSKDRRRRAILRGLSVDSLPVTIEQPANPSDQVTMIHVPRPEIAPREYHAPRRISDLLSDDCPANWLFIGDSYTPTGDALSSQWMTSPTLVSATLRKQFARPRDVFIDATYPGSRVSEVLYEFERRVLRFEPDLLFLAIGTSEATSHDTARFEQTMSRLIRWARKMGCQMVLQSPPCIPGRSDGELTRSLILVEAIRGISREHSVPLVDHWEYWEGAATTADNIHEWYDAATATPVAIGHQKLTQRVLHELNAQQVSTRQATPATTSDVPPAKTGLDHRIF